MNKKYKNRKGSITIIALFIFILIISSSTMILYFSVLQGSLSKNQLEKIQSRYIVEDNFNRFIYEDENIKSHIENEIFKTFRLGRRPTEGKYGITFKNEGRYKENIKRAFFRLDDINGRKNIVLSIDSKYENISSNIVASGTCINKIFELGKPFFQEEELTETEKDLFLQFMYRVQEENIEYDCKLDSNSMKINTNEDISLKLIRETNKDDKIFSQKGFTIESHENKNVIKCSYESIILNLKKKEDFLKSITIGDMNSKGLIKLNGVLYIEGDLIINQEFEFSGLIIINEGNIIINSLKKPKINGAIYYRGENINLDKINVIYDQDAVYKEGSFLPGFIDIEINTIKRF